MSHCFPLPANAFFSNSSTLIADTSARLPGGYSFGRFGCTDKRCRLYRNAFTIQPALLCFKFYFFSFKRSRISASNSSSRVGFGSAGGAGASSFLRLSFISARTIRNTQKEIIRKSRQVCRNAP